MTIRTSTIIAIAGIAACVELPSSDSEKSKCIKQSDCASRYGCQGGVCRQWIEDLGVISTTPFVGAQVYLVNITASGDYQVLVDYETISSGIELGVKFGHDTASLLSQATGQFSPGFLNTSSGPYMLEVTAGDGLTVKQVSIIKCEGNYENDVNNCGSCGHACVPSLATDLPSPKCVAGKCLWPGIVKSLDSDTINVQSSTHAGIVVGEAKNQDIIYFDCQKVGDWVGDSGGSNIWDHVPEKNGYVTDYYIYTGASRIGPECP